MTSKLDYALRDYEKLLEARNKCFEACKPHFIALASLENVSNQQLTIALGSLRENIDEMTWEGSAAIEERERLISREAHRDRHQ